ncbi:hypothetical protein UABAM_02111 [Candidatus Uabimicrobium amorphum]|uniref:Uncharacterized protein n=2 Tax=Uabimicrobium amorphum TaxID=2596890 RepID=A0A5S9ILK2_UABAM|nr:hypothetical protein UABAM_02111 [Candidatus Uabimicrobium amorphum]
MIFIWCSSGIALKNSRRNSIFLRDVDEKAVVYTFRYEDREVRNAIVENICKELFTAQPSQQLFNKLLKQIYTSSANVSPDVLNLQGRLFLYKVMLDCQEKVYSRAWIELWKTCAMESWRAAAKGYGKSSAHFCLYIQDWMPEKHLFVEESKRGFICGDNKKSMLYLLRNAFVKSP